MRTSDPTYQANLASANRASANLASSSWLPVGAIIALYVAAIAFLSPVDLGDTIFYVGPIVAASHHPSVTALAQLLDFGHVVWRPLGWLTYEAARHVLPQGVLGPERIAVVRVLIGIDLAAGVGAVVLLYALCRELRVRRVAAVLTCATFILCNAVVNTAQAGSSYMLAVALLTGALWLAVRSESSSWGAAVGAGILCGLATAVWFPCGLVSPAIVAAAVGPWKNAAHWHSRRLLDRQVVYLVGAGVATGAVFFGTAALILRVSSLADLHAWIQSSAHGWRQRSNLLRLGLGVPRCCFALGDAGLLWKRFLFHDPYASVTRSALVRGALDSIAFMGVFYATLCAIVYRLSKSSRGRVMLLVLAIATPPVVYFAVVLFEPSSIERFMPIFPFFFLALALWFDDLWDSRPQRALALLFPAAVLVSTTGAYRNSVMGRYWAPAVERLRDLKAQVSPGSVVALLSNQDIVSVYERSNPTADTLVPSVQFWVVLRPANEKIFCWRDSAAAEVLQTWRASRDMWVSKRLLAPAPKPDWAWVEGDDPAIRWRDVPAFFNAMGYDQATPGDDGFARLALTPDNRTILGRVSVAPCQPHGAR